MVADKTVTADRTRMGREGVDYPEEREKQQGQRRERGVD